MVVQFDLVLALVAGACLVQALMLAMLLWQLPKGIKLVNKIMAALTLVICLRLCKSVFYYLFYPIPLFGIALGFVSQLFIGPLALFFVYALCGLDTRPILRYHILPLCLGCVLLPWVTMDFYDWAYRIGLVYVIAYLLYAYYVLREFGNELVAATRIFAQRVLVALAFVWVGFVIQLLVPGGPWTYVAGIIWIVAVLFVMSFNSFRYFPLRGTKQALAATTPTVTDNMLFQRITATLQHNDMFTRSELTVAALAQHMQIPAYRLSQIINAQGITFPELLHQLRLERACSLLDGGQANQLTIEGIALSAGYKTPSAFYSAFKKYKGGTPSQYKALKAG